jgi:hypothetical protein
MSCEVRGIDDAALMSLIGSRRLNADDISAGVRVPRISALLPAAEPSRDALTTDTESDLMPDWSRGGGVAGQPGIEAEGSPKAELSLPGRNESDISADFVSTPGRRIALEVYTKSHVCSEAALARTAGVHPADLSKWKKGSLPPGSDKKARIERALKNDDAPTDPPSRSNNS